MKIKKYVFVIVFFMIVGSILGVSASLSGLGSALDSVKPVLLISTLALIYFTFRITDMEYLDRRTISSRGLLLYVMYGQIFLIVASAFFPLFFSEIGEFLGLAVNEKHERIMALTGLEEGNRAMSVFGNPNVAAKILVITYAFWIWLKKPSKITMAFVFIALLLTGSRAGVLIYVLLTIFASFSKGQIFNLWKYFFGIAISFTLLFSYADMSLGPIARIIGFTLQDNSLVYKLEMMSEILDADKAILFRGGVLDNDLIYTVVHFEGWYLAFLFTSILLLMVASGFSFINLLFLYSLSGSLLYSSVNVGVLVFIYIILLVDSTYLRKRSSGGKLRAEYAFK